MNYDIRQFKDSDINEVSKLISHLWANKNLAYNKRQLKWKYFSQPLIKTTPGYVILHCKKIIGFRGFFPSIWANDEKKIIILTPSDMVIDPKYRRKIVEKKDCS